MAKDRQAERKAWGGEERNKVMEGGRKEG